MVRPLFITLILLAPLCAQAAEGYHKDIFMDGGKSLSGYKKLRAADMMGLTYDVLATTDKATQNAVMVSSPADLNGALLFPDGYPRYRAIYINGGEPAPHGASLGLLGRQRVRTFVARGGAYTGSCAGAFIAMLHYSKPKYAAEGPKKTYFHLWPGIARTALTFDKTADLLFSKPYHPLVKKYPSLADGKVEKLYHSGGCRLDSTYYPLPKGTELIGKNHAPKLPALHGYYNILAYKKDKKTGRLVLVCSHPEGYKSGERRDLMAAILSYALDGAGAPPPLKGTLEKGKAISMKSAAQKVGDGQYHYWTFTLTSAASKISVRLDGLTSPVDIYLKQGGRPTRLVHDQSSADAGTLPRTITLQAPGPGTWVVGVHGAHQVLNGAAYTLRADWGDPVQPAADASPDGALDAKAADASQTTDGSGPADGCSISSPGGAWSLMLMLGLLALISRVQFHHPRGPDE